MRAFEKIPAFQQWQKVEAIHRGWSTDLKLPKIKKPFYCEFFNKKSY